jgi:hypothetical protein
MTTPDWLLWVLAALAALAVGSAIGAGLARLTGAL